MVGLTRRGTMPQGGYHKGIKVKSKSGGEGAECTNFFQKTRAGGEP